MRKGLVSILTPCYNGEKFIHRLLDSVLAQTYPDVEMIVVDDGSTDRSYDIVRGYVPRFEERGYSLRCIRQPNSGQSVAIDNGLKLIHGEFLVWPDSDDFYASTFTIAKMVRRLAEASSEFAMVRTMERLVDENDFGKELRVHGANAQEEEPARLFYDCLFNDNHFYFVPGAKEAADSCGIVIGTSHCEPLMRNNVGEWDVKRRGDYNYLTNRDSVQAYWIERLKEAAPYENVYTIGMRGIHDGSMEGVKTLEEKTQALQQVINDQRRLLAEYVDKDVARIPQSFVPYKEVLEIMENGLQVPDDVTLMWCDDNYGYMTRLSDSIQQKRSGGAGVYYHLSYWGRPHDYMWLCTTQPGLIYNEMKQAYDYNARRVWIVNVHDLKPAAYDLELFLDLAWNIHSVTPSTINDHLNAWLCREFGQEVGTKLCPVMLEYYRLCGIRKPEFMGWTQVELDKKRYPRGRSQVIDTEFSLTAFGGELDRYLENFEAIKQAVEGIEPLVAPRLRDAFYSHIKYQVSAASAMSVKMLEAQRARSYAMGQCDETLWEREDAMLRACANSWKAYQEIRTLTDYYNNRMADGRWRHSMCYNPRDLYVFFPPVLPVGLTEEEVKQYVDKMPCSLEKHPVRTDQCIAKNACGYTKATEGAVVIQALGHSMNAVALPQRGSLTYEFDCPWEGEAVLRTAVIPTQPNDRGDIRFSVSIDGEAPRVVSFREIGRTDTWKKNVLRGQAVKETRHTLAKGRHTLTITALDAHVVVDQWMLDFNPKRKFYVFPVE